MTTVRPAWSIRSCPVSPARSRHHCCRSFIASTAAAVTQRWRRVGHQARWYHHVEATDVSSNAFCCWARSSSVSQRTSPDAEMPKSPAERPPIGTWSATRDAHIVARGAPSRLAVASACRLATPTPSTSTAAGFTVPGRRRQHRKEPGRFREAASSTAYTQTRWFATTARPSPAPAQMRDGLEREQSTPDLGQRRSSCQHYGALESRSVPAHRATGRPLPPSARS